MSTTPSYVFGIHTVSSGLPLPPSPTPLFNIAWLIWGFDTENLAAAARVDNKYNHVDGTSRDECERIIELFMFDCACLIESHEDSLFLHVTMVGCGVWPDQIVDGIRHAMITSAAIHDWDVRFPLSYKQAAKLHDAVSRNVHIHHFADRTPAAYLVGNFDENDIYDFNGEKVAAVNAEVSMLHLTEPLGDGYGVEAGDFEAMPNELLCLIAGRMSPLAAIVLSWTCRRWRDCAYADCTVRELTGGVGDSASYLFRDLLLHWKHHDPFLCYMSASDMIRFAIEHKMHNGQRKRLQAQALAQQQQLQYPQVQWHKEEPRGATLAAAGTEWKTAAAAAQRRDNKSKARCRKR